MRIKAALVIILIVFAVTAVNLLTSRYFISRGLRETMVQDQSLIRDLANDLVGTQINILKSNASTVAERLQKNRLQDEVAEVMRTQQEEFPEFLAFTVFNRNGVLASFGDLSTHESFLGSSPYLAKAFNGEKVISTTRTEQHTGQLVFHLCVPMEDDEVLSITVSGTLFTDLLKKYRLWQTGSIFIIDEQGTLIAHYDFDRVNERINYVEQAKANPDSQSDNDFFQQMFANEEGAGVVFLHGKQHVCTYRRISASNTGWYVLTTTPLNESPYASVQEGLLFAAAFFIIVGSLVAILFSNPVVKHFSKVEEQNRNLEELNEIVQKQALQIKEEHERIKVMLDATPLACRLWNRDFQVFECNDAAVRLFHLENKKEYFTRYFDLSPKYQPDGTLSHEKTVAMLKRAFEGERCTFEWMHQTLDGVLMPTEVTLVRVSYEDDYAIAAYTLDLREHKRMIQEIEQWNNLLDTGNNAATLLLATTDEDTFEESLMESMALLGHCTNVDRVQIWRNETINGVLHFVHRYQWLSETGLKKPLVETGLQFPYSRHPDWEGKFLRGEHINAPFFELSENEQSFLSIYEIKSIVIIPLFLHSQFWGFLSLDDCQEARVFSEEEIGILRSVGLMMINALNRQMLVEKIQDEHNRVKLLLDAMPLGCTLWNAEGKIFDCNAESVRLFELRNQQEVLEQFLDLSPMYQSDGSISAEKINLNVQKAFETGRTVFEWEHQLLDGTPIPVEVTLVRINYEDEYAIAGYTRDLREHKQMVKAIVRRDFLLDTVNRTAVVMLQSEVDTFEHNLYRCMDMMAKAIGVDRVGMWKNSTVDGKLCYSKLYEWWCGEKVSTANVQTENVPYDEQVPGWRETLSRGECVFGLVRDMSPEVRARIEPQNIISVCVVPLFFQDQFWGFVGYDNYRRERVYSESERSILRSGSMLIANAILRNEATLNVRSTAAKLEVALTEARDANNAKSDFLARMSHEMRTPLNAVIGLCGLTLESEYLDEESRTNLKKIYDSGVILLSTVNDILDISKIESGKFELQPVEYELASLINDTVTQNILRIGDKPIEFVLNIDEHLPTRLYGDELRLRQIFSNILSNAVKYTVRGTVAMTIACKQESDDVWLYVSVQDTGVGIRAEDLKNVFSEYVRIDTNVNRYTEGTGLGLSITKKMAEMMDGTIEVESEYGRGSTFTVKLRQKFVTDTTIGPEMVKSLKNFQTSIGSKYDWNSSGIIARLPYAHVLIVDDNFTNLDVTRGMLKRYGMKVDCVTSGQQAIDAIHEEHVRYHAIFMDHMMPEMDGIEATHRIRNIGTEYAENIPIIALTANAVVGNEEMFLNNGFQAFLPKPIEVSRLDEVLRRWVRDKEQDKLLADQPVMPVTQNRRVGNDRRTLVDRRGAKRRKLSEHGLPELDIEKGLERFGDWKSFRDVLRSFVRHTRPLLETIREITSDSLPNYTITVHGIKGSSRGIFAENVAVLASFLEDAAREGNYNLVSRHNLNFLNALTQLMSEIEHLLFETGMDIPKKDKPDMESLSELLRACENFDMDGVDTAMKKITDYEYESDDGLAVWLQENVEQSNLAQIKERLTTLLSR